MALLTAMGQYPPAHVFSRVPDNNDRVEIIVQGLSDCAITEAWYYLKGLGQHDSLPHTHGDVFADNDARGRKDKNLWRHRNDGGIRDLDAAGDISTRYDEGVPGRTVKTPTPAVLM